MTCCMISKKRFGIVTGWSIGSANVPPAVSVLKLTGIAASSEISPLFRFKMAKNDVFAKLDSSNSGSTLSSCSCATSWSIFRNSGEKRKDRCSFWHSNFMTRSSFIFAFCFEPNNDSSRTCGENTASSDWCVHSKIGFIQAVFAESVLVVAHLTVSSMASLLKTAE